MYYYNNVRNMHLRLCLLALLLVGAGGVRADQVTKTYTFTGKTWTAKDGDGNEANWVSGKDGGGITTGQGIRVSTGDSGANATSPRAFSNVSKIVVTYNTNKAAGAGTVSVQVGTNTERSQNVAYSSGDDGTKANYQATFNYATPQSGTVKMTVTCSANSIWMKSIAITYEEEEDTPQEPEQADAAFSFPSAAYRVESTGSFAAPQLSAADGYDGTVRYASSAPAVATVEESTGEVTLVGIGTTVITASADATASFLAGEASYTLTVYEEDTDGVFDFTLGNYGSGMVKKTSTAGIDVSPKTWVSGNVTMVVEGRVLWYGSDGAGTTLNLYPQTSAADPKSSMTVSVPSGCVITHMEVTGGESLVASVAKGNGTGSKSGTTWTGAAKAVTLSYEESSGHAILTRLVVTYMVSTQDVTIGPARYITYCTPVAMSFNGVTAYVVSEVGDDYVTLDEVTRAPANTPVMLNAEAGTYGLNVVAAAPAVGTNYLHVSDGTVTGDGARYYALAADGEGVGFHVVADGVVIPAGKCYLDTEGLGAKPRLEVSVPVADGLVALPSEQPTQERTDFYTLDGRRVSVASHGIYIVNGKKIWVR